MSRLAAVAGSALQALAAGRGANALVRGGAACVRMNNDGMMMHALMSTLALRAARAGVVGGPGNRSSVSGGVATVFGATGFIGRYVVNELARHGTQVVCPYRSVEEKAVPLRQMGDLGQIVLLKGWHLDDEDMTRAAIARSNIVINLVGATEETRNFSFADVHEAWPARLAAAVADAPRVERLLHFSDMGADADHPSARMRSKAAGDAALRAAVPGATIFKPSPVVGDEDNWLNNLMGQVKLNAAVWMVDDGAHASQPTHVTDVARAVVSSLESGDSVGQDVFLAGPETVTLRDMVSLIQNVLHVVEDTTLYVPAAVAKAAYAPGDAVRRKLPPLPGRNYMYTVDYVNEISRDKLAPQGAFGYSDLGILPAKVTEGLAVEAIRYQRTGGYGLGDSKAIAKSLPTNVKRYFGMQHTQ